MKPPVPIKPTPLWLQPVIMLLCMAGSIACDLIKAHIERKKPSGSSWGDTGGNGFDSSVEDRLLEILRSRGVES